MIRELEKGNIGAVMVKDLSRLGRDHIRMDLYIEEFFPEHDIRLIAVVEGLDSSEGEDEFTPFRNLMNEWYARDISKKRKLTNVVKGNAGEPLSPPSYGYKKDPDDPKHWLVDEEAAAVVRRIYDLTLSGFGTEQVAAELEHCHVMTPMHYWRSKGLKRGGRFNPDLPFKWKSSTIVNILTLREYCGDIINFKTYSKGLVDKIAVLRDELDKADNRAVDVDSFLVSLRKYSRAKKLTERMLNELVERIEVFRAERANGEHRQKVRIHYNCVGTNDIPVLPTISDCNVQMQTRKGMVVTYSSLQKAI